jgi:hypothetical protein
MRLPFVELTDTSPDTARVLAGVYRSMPPSKKWLLVGRAYQSLRALHAAGVRLREPGATAGTILTDWVRRVLKLPGVPLVEDCAVEQVPMSITEAREVIRVLNRLGIPYALGGSMASSLYGTPRATQDSDLMVLPFLSRLTEFVAGFGPEFYLSPEAIEEAHRHSSCFNILNTSTGFKTDIFIASPGSFAEQALSRRRPVVLSDSPQEPIEVVTAEDILLLKLRWYRLGNEISERQWSDIREVLRGQAGRLEQAYLDQWAGQLGVSDLLQRARQESAAG